MLLILVALAAATIAVSAYLASRYNSAAIGRAAADAASTRWIADSGIDVAMALLQTDHDWRNTDGTGVLVEAQSIGDGMLRIELVDPATGAPPTDECTLVEVVARARVHDHEQIAIAHVRCDPWKPELALDLSDFALFADESIRLEKSATVARWQSSPAAARKPRISLGVHATAPGSVAVVDDAVAIDATLVHAGSSAILDLSSRSAPPIQLDGRVDAPPLARATPPVAGPGGDLRAPAARYDAETARIDADARIGDLLLRASRLTIADGIEVVLETNVELDQSEIVLEGDATLVVFGDLRLRNDSAILTVPNAALDLWIGGTLELDHAYLGDAGAAGAVDASGTIPYQPVAERVVRQIPGMGSDLSRWELRNGSIMVAQLHAPDREILVLSQSALYGRAAAKRILATDTAAIFYDPRLDRGTGLAAAQGIAYDASGRLVPELIGLSTIDDDTAASISSALAAIVVTPTNVVDAAPDVVADLPSTGITPRRRLARVDTIAVGRPISSWEIYKGGASGGITERIVVVAEP